jgi:hypothetical protein
MAKMHKGSYQTSLQLFTQVHLRTSLLLGIVLHTLQTLKAEKTIAQLEADEELLIGKLKQTQLQQRKAYDALQSSLAA